MRSPPALQARRGGLGANEPKRGHNRNGSSCSPPSCDLRSFGRTRTAEGVVRGENKSGFLWQRQALLFLAHCGLSRRLDKIGRDDPREAGQAGLRSHLAFFLRPPPLVSDPTWGGSWAAQPPAMPFL